MENRLRRFNRLTLCLLFIALLVMPTMAAAKEPMVSISVKSAKAKNNFIMEIGYDESKVSKVEAELKYDKESLKYLTRDKDITEGVVKISNEDKEDEEPWFQLRFMGLKKGKTTVTLDTVKAYDLKGKPIEIKNKEKEISIINVGVAGENQDIDDTSHKSQIVAERVKYEPFQRDIYHTMILFGSVAIGFLAIALVLTIIYFRRR